MLEYLKLTNVGPSPVMELELAPRINLIIGDNGLGKSFLLDVAWWAFTRKWPHDLNSKLTSGYPARPTEPQKKATIKLRITSKAKSVTYESSYAARNAAWVGKGGRPQTHGLIIYARADGGFSVWDPLRNYWKQKGNVDIQDRIPGYVFSKNDIWDGLYGKVDNQPTVLCNGLIRDWANWIKEKGENAEHMLAMLANLSPNGKLIAPGPLVRLSVNDVRDIPSIKTTYCDNVPILHASSGLRRIVGLAYILLWSWTEHLIAADILGEECASQVVILFDDIESHLYPLWQRTVLKSVLKIMDTLHDDAKIQLVAATHSPLILASAESVFDADKDALFDLTIDPSSSKVTIQRERFRRRGDVGSWLTSEIFDHK